MRSAAYRPAGGPRVLWYTSSGILGPTVKAMRRIADSYAINPWTRRLVGTILNRAGVDPRDEWGQLDAIHRYVQGLRYVPDPAGLELLNEPRWTLAAGVGDCDDMATVEASLLGAAGFRCRYGFSSKDGADEPDHVYCLVEIDGEEVICDPTREGPPGDHGPAGRRWAERRHAWR